MFFVFLFFFFLFFFVLLLLGLLFFTEYLGGPSSKLFDAVHANNLTLVEQITFESPELIGAQDPDGDSPLAIALWEKNFEIAMFFINHPAAVSFVNEHGREGDTPLHQACQWDDERQGLELMFALLKAGSDLNQVSLRIDDYHGGDYEVIDQETGEKKVVSMAHRTPLIEAVEAGHEEIVKCLLEFKAKVNERDGDGCTALYVAFDEDEDDIAEMLLKHGADPDVGNMDIGEDNTLLAWLSSRRKLTQVKMLLEQGTDPNVPGKSGLYPLHMAARTGGKQVLELLLTHGADPMLVDPSGCTPQMIATKNPKSVKNGCVEVLKKAEEDTKKNDQEGGGRVEV